MSNDLIRYILAHPPLCDVCKKKVDKFEISADVRTHSTLFLVSCHGKQEMVSLPASDEIFYGMKGGIAFKKNNLLGNENGQNQIDSGSRQIDG